MKDSSAAVRPLDEPKDPAAHYDQFFGPFYFEPYALEVVKRIDPAPVSVALELACGTGRVTRHLRECIAAGATLIASDINDGMLDVAKKKLHHPGIQWRTIDAQQLPFSDNSIDLVVCCFGYMFVPDKPKAFGEAHRVLRPGGMLLFTTWDTLEQNAASLTALSIAKEYLDAPLPESSYAATSMSDETVIKQLLQDARFSKMEVEKVKLFSVIPTAKEAASGFVKGGGFVYEEIKKRTPALMADIECKIEKELAAKFGAAPVVAPISALISRAWK